jgi:hypothetical protein
MITRMLRNTMAVATAAALYLGMATPAQAAFLGLDIGDTIDTIGFTIGAGGAVYNDTTNELDITAFADDIQLDGGGSLTQIGGGVVTIQLEVVNETLTHIFGTFFEYTATFAAQSGVTNPVEIYSMLPDAGFDDDGVFFMPPEHQLFLGKINGVIDVKHGPSWETGTIRVAAFVLNTFKAGTGTLEFTKVKVVTRKGAEFSVTAEPVTFDIDP